MADLTADQVSELAFHFLSLGQSIGNYRKTNMTSLSPADFKMLGEKQLAILDYSDKLFSASVILRMNKVSESLQRLKGIAEAIEKDILKLQSVQKIIDITEKIIVLGASIMSTNPQAVLSALDGVVETWKGTKKED